MCKFFIASKMRYIIFIINFVNRFYVLLIMKKFHRYLLLLPLIAGALLCGAQSLVLLHTNDTHSHIDAENGIGGVLQRKAIIDSVRRAEKNVLLIDAGDIVQGTLYYKLFGGEVEYPLMELLGYDMQILGNHEFDNGIESLARHYTGKPVKLAANYDFTGTALKGRFSPWIIKKIEGKKIGFFGLNLNPHGIIGAENSRGLKYKDIVSAADSTAALLRGKGCDIVIAVTHIGYTDDSGHDIVTDPKLASLTRGIDIIIGGHSHEVISPDGKLPNIVPNADGQPVLIAQTGRYGTNLGYIKIDLSHPHASSMTAHMIPVAGIDSSRFDRHIVEYLAPFRRTVNEINSHRIATCATTMVNSKKYAESVKLSNMAADIAARFASHKLDSIASPSLPSHVDLSIINSGGIRLPFAAGPVTEGQILSAFPFTNRVVVVKVPGTRLPALLKQVATHGGQAVSAGTMITYNSATDTVVGIIINGYPIDPARDYYVATLDYLANGGDYMSAFEGCETVWSDDKDFCAPVMEQVVNIGRSGIPIAPDPRPRIMDISGQ